MAFYLNTVANALASEELSVAMHIPGSLEIWACIPPETWQNQSVLPGDQICHIPPAPHSTGTDHTPALAGIGIDDHLGT